MIGVKAFLLVSTLLLTAGLITVMTRKNAIGILMGVELILNSAGLNFILFSRYVHGNVSGMIFTIFIIALAAAEVAIALAIVLAIFNMVGHIQADKLTNLKE